MNHTLVLASGVITGLYRNCLLLSVTSMTLP